MTMTTPQGHVEVVRFSGVSKSFGGRTILDCLDWTLLEGETAVILGPSGSGKSVFLSILLGFIPPDVGLVKWHDDFRESLFARTSVVFQEDALFDDRDVESNLAMALLENADPNPQLNPKQTESLHSALRDVGLQADQVLPLYPSALSGGMRRRVALARALLRNPRLLVLDEPTSGLDGETASSIFALLKAVRQTRNLSMVIITHDPACAGALGEPIYAFTPLAGSLAKCHGLSGEPEPVSAESLQAWLRDIQASQISGATAPGMSHTKSDGGLSVGPWHGRLMGSATEALDPLGRSTLKAGILAHRPSPALLWDGFLRWGLGTVPLTVLIFSLLGIVLMIQTERAVSDVGFDSKLPGLLVLGLTRLAPIIAGFLVAGRCGSAVTAQTGWMRLSGQDKAMRTMRMDPEKIQFPPIFWTFVVSMPLLALAGLAAGWSAAWLVLDLQASSARITARYFASEIMGELEAVTVAAVMAKSALIGAGIAILSYRGGMKPHRSARHITAAITRGLVQCFVWITLVDVVVTMMTGE